MDKWTNRGIDDSNLFSKIFLPSYQKCGYELKQGCVHKSDYMPHSSTTFLCLHIVQTVTLITSTVTVLLTHFPHTPLSAPERCHQCLPLVGVSLAVKSRHSVRNLLLVPPTAAGCPAWRV